MADSVMNSKEYNKIKNSYIVYELDKNHKEIASLMQESEEKAMQIEHQRTVLACTIVCLLVFVVMLGVVYAQKKKLKLAYENLFRRNKEMVQAEQANEARARRVRTPHRTPGRGQQAARLAAGATTTAATTPARRRTGAARRHPQAEEAKYSSSKVTDEQRDIILQRINKVMRNPGELLRQATSRSHKLSTLVGSNSPLRVAKSSTRHWAKNFRSFISEYRINEAQLRPARQPTTTATTPSGP